MTATIHYEGNLRCKAIHLQSGTNIETDAPTDNQGKGERFSPTDLVCTALATCMITTMAIKTAGRNIDLSGTTVSVTKHMVSEPRRIGKIEVTIQYPVSLLLQDREWLLLKEIGDHCPVMKSLHPDIEVVTIYQHA